MHLRSVLVCALRRCISLTCNWSCAKQVEIIEIGPKIKKTIFHGMSRYAESRRKGRIPAEV